MYALCSPETPFCVPMRAPRFKGELLASRIHSVSAGKPTLRPPGPWGLILYWFLPTRPTLGNTGISQTDCPRVLCFRSTFFYISAAFC